MNLYEILKRYSNKTLSNYPSKDLNVEITILKEPFTLEEAFIVKKLNFFLGS